MAATATQRLTSFTNISPKNLSSDIRAGKHDYRQAEKIYEESPSTFSQISSEICNSRIESRSPNNEYASWSSISEPKSASCVRNGEIADGDSVHTKASDRTTHSVVRKTRVSACLSATESGVSDHEQSMHDKVSVTPRNKMIGLQENCITPGSDLCVESRGGALDSSQCSHNNSKTSFRPEKGERQVYDGNKQTSLSDVESRSQKCDLPQAKQSCYSNSQSTGDKEGKGTNANQSRTTVASSIRQSNHTLHYNVSELTLKLRGSMESEFLSNELRKQDASTQNTNADSKETYRTVDEILRHYGIASVTQSSQYKKVAYNNISQNNETSQGLGISDSGKKKNTISSKPREALSQLKRLPKENMATLTRKEPRINPPFYIDNTKAKMPGVTYKINLSQNNETKYGTAHQDLLRKYGSSVDYSSIAAGGRYSVTSASNNFGRYDYGKSTFPGDAVSGVQTSYMNTKVPDFEVKKSNLLSRQLEGSQVDILKPTDMAVSNGDDFNTIRHTGSSIDAVDFTISSERQRLRRLNNMITSTSVTTSDATAHKSLMTRYLSPQRDYESIRASNMISKVYSSPTVPSSHYGISVTPKSSWADSSIGQHDTSILMSKSASVPNTWNNGFQTVTNYSTSVDSRSPYLPHYSSRDFDYQFNNSMYRSLSMERLASQIHASKNHASSFLKRKQESPLRRPSKHGISTPTKHTNYNQSRCPLKNVSNLSLFSDASYTTKSESRKHVSTKHIANKNINDSKSTSEIYRSLGNPKSHNKAYSSRQQAKTTHRKGSHKQQVSTCSPHACHPPCRVQKVETFHNFAKELFKNKCSQASTKSKHTRSGTRKANSPGGHSEKSNGREREPAVVPSRKTRGVCYVQPSLALCETNQRILRSAEKKKERMASEILIQKINAMPKSIHKHNNHLSGNMAAVYRPHSPHATSSRSYPQFSAQQPYQVYRDFSTTNFYSTGLPYI